MPDSEVCRPECRAGESVAVSGDTALLVRRAVDGWRLSQGRFNPRPWPPSSVPATTARSPSAPWRPGPSPTPVGCGHRPTRPTSGADACTVRLPDGVRVRPVGGAGKGLAADLAAAEAWTQGAAWCCVNRRPRARSGATAPEAAPGPLRWSTRSRRRRWSGWVCATGPWPPPPRFAAWWLVDGLPQHHLIDPTTGSPSATHLALASVVTAKGWMARGAGQGRAALGREAPFAVLGGVPAEGLAVTTDGAVHWSDGIGRFTGEQTHPARTGRRRDGSVHVDAAGTSGITAWTVLAASVLWGLALSTKVMEGRPRPAWLCLLHRFLGGTALIFTGIHVTALVAGTRTCHSAWSTCSAPMASSWRPGPVAWGVVSLWLLLAVELTSLARRYLPRRAWR